MNGRPSEKSAPESTAAPPVGRVLGLTMVAIFSTTLFMRAVDPLVPQIADYFTVDPHTVALLATAFSLPYAITLGSLPAGKYTLSVAITDNLAKQTITPTTNFTVKALPANAVQGR